MKKMKKSIHLVVFLGDRGILVNLGSLVILVLQNLGFQVSLGILDLVDLVGMGLMVLVGLVGRLDLVYRMDLLVRLGQMDLLDRLGRLDRLVLLGRLVRLGLLALVVLQHACKVVILVLQVLAVQRHDRMVEGLVRTDLQRGDNRQSCLVDKRRYHLVYMIRQPENLGVMAAMEFADVMMK